MSEIAERMAIVFILFVVQRGGLAARRALRRRLCVVGQSDGPLTRGYNGIKSRSGSCSGGRVSSCRSSHRLARAARSDTNKAKLPGGSGCANNRLSINSLLLFSLVFMRIFIILLLHCFRKICKSPFFKVIPEFFTKSIQVNENNIELEGEIRKLHSEN